MVPEELILKPVIFRWHIIRSSRGYAVPVLLFVLMFASSLAVGQSEFSADVIRTRKGGKDGSTLELKIYVGEMKARLEPQIPNSPPPPQLAPFFIVAERKGTAATLVMPQRHEYSDAPQQMTQQYLQYFRLPDKEDGCVAFFGTRQNQWTCHKVGDKTLDERAATEYEATKSNGEWFRFWIDRKICAVVKMETDKDAYELRNIQEGSQPAKLFEIPSDYTQSKVTLGTIGSVKPK